MSSSPVELLFRQQPKSNPAELLFGEVESLPDADIAVNITLPPLTVAALIGREVEVTANITLPALTVSANVLVFEPIEIVATIPLPPLTVAVSADYDIAVSRPLVNQRSSSWQKANALSINRGARHNVTVKRLDGKKSRWQGALGADLSSASAYSEGVPVKGASQSGFEDATRVQTWETRTLHQDAIRDRRQSSDSVWQNGVPVRFDRTSLFSDMLRGARPEIVAKWDQGVGVRKQHDHDIRLASTLRKPLLSTFQQAWRPRPGQSQPPQPPGPEPCYLPDTNLLFDGLAATDGHLIFICERHDGGGGGPTETIVVPVRSVYMVINNILLRRVSDNFLIPTFALSLSIDADSWTWGFSASLPATALDAVMPSASTPIELDASINGTSYRVIVESIGRERAFNSDTIRISGRGKNAVLAAPYAPTQTFTNASQRTAQQLMDDVLTLNNVPLGWTIDWQLDDWLVPAGAFAAQGSYIDGLTAIASAAGAYLQPHPTLQQMRVLLQYPIAPWEWATVTPDYELPSAVTVRESTEWIDKPAYNRVFVSGQSQGILGQVTRTGTAGDLVAPMVTDPLITEVNAARQRGISVLGDTGRKALLGLRLPILQETGVILPGKFVRYTDGADEMIGIVRGTNVEATSPEAWQTLEVETQL